MTNTTDSTELLAIWRWLGGDLKDIEAKMLEVIFSPAYQRILTKAELDKLARAIDWVTKFQISAEKRMNTKYGIDDDSIFW